MEALVLFEPGLHFRMFVRGVVVDDQVQLKVLGRFPIDFLEEVQPLLMPVLALDRTDQLPLKVIERSEQGHGAMANVIVRLRADISTLEQP
ncbi:Glucan phosphorylase [Pseudomonas syringae pv. actinidiae]|uniref:Glucan phosphorylase n=1 Tax=Pseudomonas syringae pv. actinidiae TaxID=103796 RepID=A0A2V0QRP4_PSESF|nr:Glucan phosphorylase [Pseudomonas syringae pv. actinidiae]